jgi:hypothetical protein
MVSQCATNSRTAKAHLTIRWAFFDRSGQWLRDLLPEIILVMLDGPKRFSAKLTTIYAFFPAYAMKRFQKYPEENKKD